MIKNFRVEALWDCVYCGNQGIGGSQHSCPNCGNPRGQEVKFYLPKDLSKVRAVDETKVKISSGPDWLCSYCSRYNRSDEPICVNCAAPREKGDKNYLQIRIEKSKK